MKIFFSLWRRFERWIFTEEFLLKQHDPASKAVFIMYGLAGGFCFDPNIRLGFRKVWIGFNIFNFLVVYVSCTFYLFNAPLKDYYALLLPAPVMTGQLAKFGVYFCAFLMRNVFSKLFEFLNRHDDDLAQFVAVAEKENYIFSLFPTSDSEKSTSKILVILCWCPFIFSLMQNLGNYVKCDDYVIYNYPMYAPYTPSSPLRFILRLLQNITLAPEIILLLVFPTLFYSIAVNIYKRFQLLGLSLRKASYSAFLSIDEAINLETAMAEQRIPSSEAKIEELKTKRSSALDEFVGKCIQVIKQHQQLYSTAKLYTDKVKFVCFVVYIQNCLTTITAAFFISSIIESEQFKFFFVVPLFIIFIAEVFMWLVFCYIGELFQRMNEEIAMEFYCGPWYHLEPRDRRFILTALAVFQRPIRIVICGVYSVNLSFFPNIMNVVYNHTQILRTLQLNKQKRV